MDITVTGAEALPRYGQESTWQANVCRLGGCRFGGCGDAFDTDELGGFGGSRAPSFDAFSGFVAAAESVISRFHVPDGTRARLAASGRRGVQNIQGHFARLCLVVERNAGRNGRSVAVPARRSRRDPLPARL